MTTLPAARILIWDLPTRLFHWLLALAFAVGWWTGEEEQFRLIHVLCGYSIAVLVVFRIVWGMIGTRHARFAEFLRGPQAIARHLQALRNRERDPSPGHNPIGGWAVLLLLGMCGATAFTGWRMASGGGEQFEEIHGLLANATLALVGMHVLGVLVTGWLQREHLIGAMFSGRKQADPAMGISRTVPWVALLLMIMLGGFWGVSLKAGVPAFGLPAGGEMHEDGGGGDKAQEGGERERDND